MQNRYKKIVLEAEEGIIFDVSEETEKELTIRALKDDMHYFESSSIYSENYFNPPVPEGYEYVEAKWSNGYVIQRSSDGSQFVWIPVGSLNPDGTLDGKNFTEKFGRRNFKANKSYFEDFNEPLSDEFLKQFESVKKYGGFYISRYNISRSSSGEPQSVKDAIPWGNVNCDDAIKISACFERNEEVKSHLTYGAEYDSVLAWFLKTNVRSLRDIAVDSTIWGNYWNTDVPIREKTVTGYRKIWCTNNIYDFAGNVEEWTQELYKNINPVSRGGFFMSKGDICPVVNRIINKPNCNFHATGFRIVLDIK